MVSLQRGRGPETAERHPPQRPPNTRSHSFNGAAVRRPRRVFRAQSGKPERRRFNGAAVRRPRRALESNLRDLIDQLLQRGRGPETAESAERRMREATGRCGFNGAAVRRPRRDKSSFGRPGPRPLLQRGRGPETAESDGAAERHARRSGASTGPRSGDRGEPTLPAPAVLGWIRLQRGRGPETAESCSGATFRRGS